MRSANWPGSSSQKQAGQISHDPGGVSVSYPQEGQACFNSQIVASVVAKRSGPKDGVYGEVDSGPAPGGHLSGKAISFLTATRSQGSDGLHS